MTDRTLGLIVCAILGLFTATLVFAFLVPWLEHRTALLWSGAAGVFVVLSIMALMGARDG